MLKGTLLLNRMRGARLGWRWDRWCSIVRRWRHYWYRHLSGRHGRCTSFWRSWWSRLFARLAANARER